MTRCQALRFPERREGPDFRPDPLVTSLVEHSDANSKNSHFSNRKLLVELSEADSKKWRSLVEHGMSAQLVDDQPTAPTSDAQCQRRVLKQRQARLSDARVQEMVAGYLSGSSVYELAAQFGCHRKTVSSLLKSAGIALRLASMTADQIMEAAALYESGLSLAKTGARLGFNANTVRLRLIEHGIRMRDSHGRTLNA